jgi:hypothetical protein
MFRTGIDMSPAHISWHMILINEPCVWVCFHQVWFGKDWSHVPAIFFWFSDRTVQYIPKTTEMPHALRTAEHMYIITKHQCELSIRSRFSV